MRDVVVIGAGPAGALAAQTLAERGRDAVLLEEHPSIGAPTHCTGLLGLEAFDEFDLPRHVILGVAESARFWGASGQSITVRSERISASVVDRRALDEALVGRAEAAGAEVRTGTRVDRVRVESDRVVVTDLEGGDRGDSRPGPSCSRAARTIGSTKALVLARRPCFSRARNSKPRSRTPPASRSSWVVGRRRADSAGWCPCAAERRRVLASD